MALIPKIAFLCDRLGPYHVARLNAASRHADIIAIEFSASDQTYAWDFIETSCDFQRVTLFSETPINLQPIKVIVKRINNVLDEIKPQVVAIPGWDAPASLIALRWSLLNNTPSILMSDSQQHDEIRGWWKESIKRRIVRLHSSGFVAGSSHIDYLKVLGMPEANIVTGIDVVDNVFFAKSGDECQQNADVVRKELGLPEKYFLASNRFIQKKNLFLLLKAYADYCQKVVGDPWKLVLLGDGHLKQHIISYRDKLGLSNSVMLPGFKQYNELPAYYGLAGAFIHASTSEQWGLVVNEAMACGLPVIVSTPCGCTPDLVRNGYNGYTFDPYDTHELTVLMAHISSNACNRAVMGQASRDIIGYWSLDAFTSNLVKTANKALAADKPQFDYFSKAMLCGLIHRKRSH